MPRFTREAYPEELFSIHFVFQEKDIFWAAPHQSFYEKYYIPRVPAISY
jgi:hypothetical protein